MADNQGQGQLILAQNQYAFIQDTTKGPVQVYAGPVSVPMSQSDRPVIYNPSTSAFDAVSVLQAIKLNASVQEGDYLVLENPAFDGDKLKSPRQGGNGPTELQVGRKIVISGPASFPLWPGQTAQSIRGHHLRSNQYLIVRVYNAQQANENGIDKRVSEDLSDDQAKLVNGQLFVIKGTEASFFIPNTGFEVLQEGGEYVREALTLERLEYCILLDENGNKRYEEGPQVVFPKATERFVRKNGNGDGTANQNSLKFKAIELNDQMGLYIKVIADYEENGKFYKAGEELFLTGKEQRIYYPRPEHALIEYKDPESNFMRQKYYSIAIPKGEGRYILDKTKGEIDTVKGPQMFLPDPRNQTIVRRVLDKKTVGMWYPGNQEALAYNATLRSVADLGQSYVTETSLSGSVDAMGGRGINRGTMNSKGIAPSSTADQGNGSLTRSGVFTPPPSLTLNTKFDGVPAIGIWTGYAVQVVNKSGERRVVVGPTTLLLEYDESLEVLTLSTGKPKTTDVLKSDVYLRYENNLVSDVVNIITKDNVDMSLKVSYRVNFLLEEKDKWFSVENYVKFLTDHTRSLIKAAAKTLDIKEVNDKATVIFRDVVLGKKDGDKPRSRVFTENGMVITDVEVLGLTIQDQKIAKLLKDAQQQTVETTIALASEEQSLSLVKRQMEVQASIAKLKSDLTVTTESLRQEELRKKNESNLLNIEFDAAQRKAQAEVNLSVANAQSEVSKVSLETTKAAKELDLTVEGKQVEYYKQRYEAISPALIEAMITLGQSDMATKLSAVIAPLAIQEHSGLGATVERVFKGTALEPLLLNMKNSSVETAKAPVTRLPLPK